MLNLIVAVVFFLTGSLLNAQQTKATDAQVKPADKAKLADEIIVNLGFDKKIQESIDGAKRLLKTPRKLKDPSQATAQKNIQAAALLDFEKKAPGVKTAMTAELNTFIQKQFSEAELKYLATASKYQLLVKLISMVTTPEFVRITDNAFTAASLSVKEAERSLGSAPGQAPPAPGLKK